MGNPGNPNQSPNSQNQNPDPYGWGEFQKQQRRLDAAHDLQQKIDAEDRARRGLNENPSEAERIQRRLDAAHDLQKKIDAEDAARRELSEAPGEAERIQRRLDAAHNLQNKIDAEEKARRNLSEAPGEAERIQRRLDAAHNLQNKIDAEEKARRNLSEAPGEAERIQRRLDAAHALQKKIDEEDRARRMAGKNQDPGQNLTGAEGGQVEAVKTRIKEIDQEIKDLEGKDAEDNKIIENINQEIDSLRLGPAINADLSHDARELANDLSEQLINSETGFVGKLFKKTLFKKYFARKYANEFMNGKRKTTINGREVTVEEAVRERSSSALERFQLGITEDSKYIHDQVGESYKAADAETQNFVKGAIESFVEANREKFDKTNPENVQKLKLAFDEHFKKLQAEAKDSGQPIKNANLVNNYSNVALQALELSIHGKSMDDVMKGFMVYNADVRDSVRTEAHLDNLDKILNSIEDKGLFVPAQALAIGVSVVSALTQTGARMAAGVAGGVIASGIISGARERNRINEDRVRKQRDAANGLKYGDSKYEKKIGGTLYDARNATELTQNIKQAIDGGKRDEILKAIAEARVRIDYSDSEKRDLVCFSSQENRGRERLDLDLAVIRAEKIVKEIGGGDYLDAEKSAIQKQIEKDVAEKDEKFKKLRLHESLKKAGFTIGMGVATFILSQEIRALLDPTKLSLVEKLRGTGNGNETSETFLASRFGSGNSVNKLEFTVSSDEGAKIKELEDQGYTRTLKKQGIVDVKRKLEIAEVKPSEAAEVKYKIDTFADNGTKAADGNELRIFQRNGQIISGMRGNSIANGKVLNYDELAAAGKVKGIVKVGGARFEVVSNVNSAGQLTWGEGGVFTTTTGETIKAIGDNGEELFDTFEVVFDNGVDADGIQHIIPAGTEVGKGTFDGLIKKFIESRVVTKEPDEYLMTKITSMVVDRTGVAAAVDLGRQGLGAPVEERNQAAA